MKAEIYCRKCENNDVRYLGDNRLKCNNCGNVFDIYDGILDILKEK